MQQKLYFSDSQGNKLCGILSNPSEDISKPIIILCHGHNSSKDRKSYVILEQTLNGKNISTFKFDFYGHGESDGKFEDCTISKAVDCILQAIEFLKEKNYPKIGLIGSSFGGMASLVAATQTKSLFVLGLKAPVSDYLGKMIAQKSEIEIEDWEKNGFIEYFNNKKVKLRLNYSFFEDSKKYNNYYEHYKNIDIPTLIVHGDKDVTVPIKQSIKAASIIPNCQLEIIKGADHFFKEEDYFDRVTNLLSEFILENCKKIN